MIDYDHHDHQYCDPVVTPPPVVEPPPVVTPPAFPFIYSLEHTAWTVGGLDAVFGA